VKLWIDECLSPTLVERANRRGYWATCNRDRDLLGVRDDVLHKIAIAEEAVFVTNNEADFVALYRRVDLHTGLLILPQTETREALWPLLDTALDYIERQAKAAAETAAEWMLNRRVEIDPSGTATHEDLPEPDAR
jgi:predicted nuclease of predicted toxin-antitoxin system